MISSLICSAYKLILSNVFTSRHLICVKKGVLTFAYKMETNQTLNSTDENEDHMLTDGDKSSAVAVWAIVDFFIFLYYLTFLAILLKKHQDHLQPVHILTLNTLVDVTIAVFIYFIHELLVVLTGSGLSHVVMFDNLFGFLLSLDVITQDLDGLLFSRGSDLTTPNVSLSVRPLVTNL